MEDGGVGGVGKCRLRNVWACREVVALLPPGWFTTGWVEGWG